MERTFRVVDDESTDRKITGIRHPDWTGLDGLCPECGAREYRHFRTEGGRYGHHDGTVVLQSDYWDANQRLFTQCLNCDCVLYKHPAFDLLFDIDNDQDTAFDFDVGSA